MALLEKVFLVYFKLGSSSQIVTFSGHAPSILKPQSTVPSPLKNPGSTPVGEEEEEEEKEVGMRDTRKRRSRGEDEVGMRGTRKRRSRGEDEVGMRDTRKRRSRGEDKVGMRGTRKRRLRGGGGG